MRDDATAEADPEGDHGAMPPKPWIKKIKLSCRVTGSRHGSVTLKAYDR